MDGFRIVLAMVDVPMSPLQNGNNVFLLEDGDSALVLSADGSEISVRTSICPQCSGTECGIPESSQLVAALAVIIDSDPHFRSWLASTTREIMAGTYVPLAFREDLH
jgi:hypothetical protein